MASWLGDLTDNSAIKLTGDIIQCEGCDFVVWTTTRSDFDYISAQAVKPDATKVDRSRGVTEDPGKWR